MDDIEHDHCHGKALVTPEADAAIARRALGDSDPGHALFHVAGALATKPGDLSLHALLEEALASVDDPLELTTRKAGDYYALFAVRAWALRRAGRSRRRALFLGSVGLVSCRGTNRMTEPERRRVPNGIR